jgi:hypothetical protein
MQMKELDLIHKKNNINMQQLQISIEAYLLHNDGVIPAIIYNIVKHAIPLIPCCYVTI